jgi:hypothetical protein
MKTSEAIEWAGGTQVALALKLGINQPSVSGWGEFPPALRQIQIQLLSNGALQAEPSCLPQAKTEPVT